MFGVAGRFEKDSEGAEAVLARGQLDGERVGATLDQAQQIIVLAHRVLSAARNIGEHGFANGGQTIPATVHEIKNVQIRAVLENHRVEVVVQRRKPFGVKRREDLTHLGIDGASGGDITGLQKGCRHGCGHALDKAERLHGVPIFTSIGGNDLRANVLRKRDESLGFETSDGFANGHRADVEFGSGLAENEAEARSERTVGDVVLDVHVGALGLAGNESVGDSNLFGQ